jgi:hypothetical protein
LDRYLAVAGVTSTLKGDVNIETLTINRAFCLKQSIILGKMVKCGIVVDGFGT